MSSPTMMRYQPKSLKPYLAMKLTNHFMARMATTNETKLPMSSVEILPPLKP